jgi:HEPN domain-containing protein
MATQRELQQLACLRLEEAEALFGTGCYDGCAYLCGYVVELALKAAICSTLGLTEFPEKGSRLKESFKTHDFDDLKLLAGMDQAFTANSTLLANWSVASKWKPERRYEIKGTYDQASAKGILDAVREYPVGVLACMSSHW